VKRLSGEGCYRGGRKEFLQVGPCGTSAKFYDISVLCFKLKLFNSNDWG
jgi:hypothetical protein